MPDEPALTNLLTAAFLTLLAHTVRAFLLCTSLRALVGLYVALRETFHHRSRLPRGRARTPDPSPVPANVDLVSYLLLTVDGAGEDILASARTPLKSEGCH